MCWEGGAENNNVIKIDQTLLMSETRKSAFHEALEYLVSPNGITLNSKWP